MGAGRPEKSSEGCPLSVSAVPTKSCAAPAGNHAVGGSSLSRKNIPFLFSRKSVHLFGRPTRQEGRCARHERAVGCGGRGACEDERKIACGRRIVWSWRSYGAVPRRFSRGIGRLKVAWPRSRSWRRGRRCSERDGASPRPHWTREITRQTLPSFGPALQPPAGKVVPLRQHLDFRAHPAQSSSLELSDAHHSLRS